MQPLNCFNENFPHNFSRLLFQNGPEQPSQAPKDTPKKTEPTPEDVEKLGKERAFNMLKVRIQEFNDKRFSPGRTAETDEEFKQLVAENKSHYQEWHDIMQALVEKAGLKGKIEIYGADRVQHDIGIEDGKIFIENMEGSEDKGDYTIFKMVKYYISPDFTVQEKRWESKKEHPNMK